VLVSHDRHLLRATTDQFIIVADARLKPFDGDLDDYKAWLLQNKLDSIELAKKKNLSTPAPTDPAPVPVAATVPAATPKASTLNPSKRKSLESKLARIDDDVARLTRELTAIAAQLEDSDLYQEHRKAELKALLGTQSNAQQSLELAEAQWLDLHEQLEG
jgi:ATP-binding cassette subfamily F protein 3